MRYQPLLSLLAIGLVSVCAIGWKISQTPAEQMQTFAVAYLETLDADQRSKTVLDFDSPDRVRWHFIPKDQRKGLMLGDMNDAQRTAALRLLRSALSESGYFKANRIMLLEEVLNELEAGKGRWERSSQRYFVTVFGNPQGEKNRVIESDATQRDNKEQSNRWGLSFEGHHLSLNFVCRGNQVVDSTPQFLAANPATVMNDTSVTLGKGTSVLNLEENLGFKLINSLAPQQQELAIIAEDAPADVRFAGDTQPTVGDPEGISFNKLDDSQKQLLKEIISLYTDLAPEAIASRRQRQIRVDGWGQVWFAWAGALKPGIGHYYRIRGKRFLIEFVNTQSDSAGNPANHIHTVYRDLSGDFDLPIAP